MFAHLLCSTSCIKSLPSFNCLDFETRLATHLDCVCLARCVKLFRFQIELFSLLTSRQLTLHRFRLIYGTIIRCL